MAEFSRRQLLQRSIVTAAGATWSHRVFAQANTPLAPLNRNGGMVHEFYDTQIRAVMAARDQRLENIRTRAEAESYISDVRARIRQSFGPFPEKTPLNPRVSGIVDRDVYTIEKIAFESRPGFFVTANLYVPKDRAFPLPGVVGLCGHSLNGKAYESYQAFSQGLARQGYVVLIIDPIGQGERFQFPSEDLQKSTIGGSVQEHLHVGNQQFLVNEFFGTWRAWDAIRALDYLLTRSEVDPKHVGVTGNSGGGTMTMWVSGLDDRWTMSAPACAVTSFARNFQNELPADTEQCPPRALAMGLDHGDFLAALAPKPVIILAQERDYFDARGAEHTYQQLRKLWGFFGAADRVQLQVGPDPHGYSQPNREAMYGFFNSITGVSTGRAEPALTIEKDETLHVMPRGQVAEIPSKAVVDFTRATATDLASQRPQHDARSLATALRQLLKLPATEGIPDYRILRPTGGRKYPRPHATQYAVATEPGIETIVYRLTGDAHLSRPPKTDAPCLLYVSHQSADAELRSDPWLKSLVERHPDGALYACDVRGTGETQPTTCGGAQTYLTPYGNDYFYAIHGLMLDRPYPGQKTWDVLQVIAWLQGLGHPDVHLVAQGWGTIPATFAAVLSEGVTQVTLRHALTSYQAIAESADYEWPLSLLVPGILATCDLPDCYRVLQHRKLEQIEPWNEMAQPAG